MRDCDLDGHRLPSRVRGRVALERSLRRVLLQAGRFSQFRAQSLSDAQWVARVIDVLRHLLEKR